MAIDAVSGSTSAVSWTAPNASRVNEGQKPTHESGSQEVNSENKLSEEDQKKVEELRKRDQEVRAHEQAHMAAGAGIVRGGPSYEMEKGPDGRMYAVGGEVSIDTSEADTPQATIIKMQKVRAAALAPGNPSGQDRSVAAQASSTEAKARTEMAKSIDPKNDKGQKIDVFG